MENKRTDSLLYLSVFILLLSGCTSMTVESQDTDQDELTSGQAVQVEDESKTYEFVLEKGLEELDYKNYEKAMEYFERALEKRAGDERAKVLLSQTTNFREAEELLEGGEYERSRAKAEFVRTLENGSETLTARAAQLLEETEEHERVEVEDLQAKDSDSLYAYSDFVGYYLHFLSNDPSQSDMVVTIGDQYLTLGWYASELELYQIEDWTLDENVLTIDYYLHPYGEKEGEYGTLSVSLEEENGRRYIDFGTDMPFYKTAYDQLQNYGYTMPETVVEDVKE